MIDVPFVTEKDNLKFRSLALTSVNQLTLFHMGGGGGGADSALLQIVFFITSARDAAELRTLVTFPKI